jgi:hypothetical protein
MTCCGLFDASTAGNLLTVSDALAPSQAINLNDTASFAPQALIFNWK